VRKQSQKSRLRRILTFVAKCTFVLALSSLALVLMFRFFAPPMSALMLERRVEASWHKSKHRTNYNWVKWQQISPSMGVAVIAAEDQNFLHHHGFDWKAIQKAIEYNENSDRTRGASTITQQTAKNLFLWSRRNWVRKGLEAYFTVLLEVCWNKHRILETYLNIAEFGDGIFGVEAAAQEYFKKPASRLTSEEAALLAAVLPNPRRLKANAPSAYVRARQEWILEQMNQLGGVHLLDNRT